MKIETATHAELVHAMKAVGWVNAQGQDERLYRVTSETRLGQTLWTAELEPGDAEEHRARIWWRKNAAAV